MVEAIRRLATGGLLSFEVTKDKMMSLKNKVWNGNVGIFWFVFTCRCTECSPYSGVKQYSLTCAVHSVSSCTPPTKSFQYTASLLKKQAQLLLQHPLLWLLLWLLPSSRTALAQTVHYAQGPILVSDDNLLRFRCLNGLKVCFGVSWNMPEHWLRSPSKIECNKNLHLFGVRFNAKTYRSHYDVLKRVNTWCNSVQKTQSWFTV